MQWFLVILFIAVIGAVVVLSTTMKRTASAGAVDPHAEVLKGPHVRYRVPTGQDPVVVLARVREAGYTAVPGPEDRGGEVVVALAEDVPQARDALRRVIAGARATNVEGPPALDPAPVHFEGESGST
jgi:hypothetical protein